MLTNLDWLTPGAAFPPASEKNRLSLYSQNEKLFLTQHAEVWKEAFHKLASAYRKKNLDVETILNYHQLLSKKTADFVCGEPPILETEGDTDKLKQLLDKLRFNGKLYEGVLDVSKCGNGILKLVGQGLSLVSPSYWFPIVLPSDLKTIGQHVIAYPLTPNAQGKMTELYVEIHDIGKVEIRLYSLDGEKGIIGGLKDGYPQIKATNLKDFAIQVLSNLTYSGSIYGIDDYTIINSLIQKLLWRLHCCDTILDKHSEPSISGPESALTLDERTGLWIVSMGNYFKRRNADDPDLHYVTWDGNLDPAFKELELLLDQAYILTEMGQAFAEGGGTSEASGTALKLRMVSPRIKAQRIVGINDATVKTVISMLAAINGINIQYDTLTIRWKDGLPVDENEQLNTLSQATGGKPIMSQYSAIKRLGNSDAETEAELEQIRKEDAAAAPFVLGGINLNNQNPTAGG